MVRGVELRPLLRLALLFVLVAGVCPATRAQTFPALADFPAPVITDLEISVPGLTIAGVPFAVRVEAPGLPAGLEVPVVVRVIRGAGADPETVLEGKLTGGQTLLVPGVSTPGGGHALIEVASGIYSERVGVRSLPGFLTLFPPLLAIILAIFMRQVVVSLLAGVWLGALLTNSFDPLAATLRVLDGYLLGAIIDRDHGAIILFTMLLGGMVALMTRSGGTYGIVEAVCRWSRTRRSTQMTTWMLGLFIFFDDYANTLIVGNTMRPITDRQRISREKLAYLVDCTAAPIASIALISTWIGVEVSLIGDALADVGSDLEPYQVFLASIPYRFYPILALAFAFMVAASRRDFGPMLRAERRALLTGDVIAPGSTPVTDQDSTLLEPVAGQPLRWINGVAPIAVVIGVTLVGLWSTGRASLAGAGDPLGSASFLGILGGGQPVRDLGSILSAADSYVTLIWGSALGGLVAALLTLGQGLLGLRETLETWMIGLKSMLNALVILVLAWSIGSVCDDLNTAGYMVGAVSDALPWAIVPALVFVVAGFVAFATGTSWATMGILMPLSVPLAMEIAAVNGLDAATSQTLLLGTISSVLAGAVWGDHCSPLSDTTVLSSMASGSDHIDHVRTQLPYAILVGGVGLLVGDLPSAFGFSPWLSLLVGVAVLALFLFIFGRRAEDSVKAPAGKRSAARVPLPD